MTSYGRIHLARHGEPDLNRRVRLNAREYDEWWAAYQKAGLVPGQEPPADLQRVADLSTHLVASTLRRARETAETLAPDRNCLVDDLFVEAPLPAPPFPFFLRFTPRMWGAVSRVVWWLGYSGGQETRREAENRADQAAEFLIELATQNCDVLLCAHGWFNRMIKRALQNRGWTCTHNGGDRYWSWRRFERRT